MGGNGLFYGGDQLRTQVMGIIVIIAWTAILSILIFAPLRKIGWLRLGDAFQDTGADIMEHSPIRASANLGPTEPGKVTGAVAPAAAPGALADDSKAGDLEKVVYV